MKTILFHPIGLRDHRPAPAAAPQASSAWSLTNDQVPDHRRHLLGEIDFFRRQPNVGIAYAEGGQLGYYWVILIGQCDK